MEPTGTIAIDYGLLKEVAIELTDYSVSFAELYEHSNQEYADLKGSGTLISVEGKYAILTADHVLKELQKSRDIGLILGSMVRPQRHRFTIDMESDLIKVISIARGNIESHGPDLGLLCIFDTKIINNISTIKSFYNLSKRSNQFLSAVSVDLGCWYICGMVAEMTTDAPPEPGYKIIKKFCGICNPGEVTKEHQRENFDYLDFIFDEAYKVPQNFGGISGGSLWQVTFNKDQNGKPIVKDRILSGVVFYQSDIENNRRIIRCHGRRSIYHKVFDVLYNAV
jgi:hypothetical protein